MIPRSELQDGGFLRALLLHITKNLAPPQFSLQLQLVLNQRSQVFRLGYDKFYLFDHSIRKELFTFSESKNDHEDRSVILTIKFRCMG